MEKIIEVKAKVSVDDSEVDRVIDKLEKVIELEKELQAIQSSMESSNSIDLDGHSIAKAVLKANRDTY
ncbi:hypothetical protein [Hespellia stercorisuis]|uniref:Uncharacterized protein n=1 Tax=Hespellia stercorisuis DSM 15480 TaxID=1121950 RepID=A0A1M6VGG8_9FIRM|nr:hypothetical protein [Hespellia stercorisuis]SHK80603.1 hypothetical protein SAMN02745243_03765 [Hespellia stercorisuis DSM 15480]